MVDYKLDKLKIICVYLVLVLAVSHGVGAILAIGCLTASFTFLIYSGFILGLFILLFRLIKIDEFNEERESFIFCTVVSLLNMLANIILLTTDVDVATIPNPPLDVILKGLMIFHIILDIIIFITFFFAKIRYHKMDGMDKLAYFSILLTRGLGLNYLFQTLAWITPVRVPIMILYLLTFGVINLALGRLLYNRKKEDKQFNLISIGLLTKGLIIGVVLVFFYFSVNSVLFLILYVIDIIIRILYVKIKL